MKKKKILKIKTIWNKIKKPLFVFSVILNILFGLAMVIGLSSNNKKPQSASAVNYESLTFSSSSSFTLRVVDNHKYWNGTIEYSTNNVTWSTWFGTTTITSGLNGTDYRIHLRGIGNTYITGDNGSPTTASWVLTGSNISCIGNIEYLLDYSSVLQSNHPIMAQGCYRYLFYGNSNLINAPELPATTLSNFCYYFMFANCSSLITSPVLPATTLKEYCYSYMFKGCTSLINAPVLSSTSLERACYCGMFDSCTSLTTSPTLSATTLYFACYEDMFKGCISLTDLPELPATTLPSLCYDGMFWGCISVKLSESQTEEYDIPYRIPVSSTATAQNNSLTNMFLNTGGTFTGTPTINTTYYLSNLTPDVELPEYETKKTINLTDNFNPVTYITRNGNYIFNGFAGYNPNITTNYVDLTGLDFISNGFEYNRIRLVYSQITAVAPTITQDGVTYITLDGSYSDYACCIGMFYQYIDSDNGIVRNVQVLSYRRTVIEDNGVQVKAYDVRQPYMIWLNNNYRQLEVIEDEKTIMSDTLLSITGLTTYQLLQVTSSVNDSVMGLTDVFGLLKGAFNGLIGILTITILPGITLGLLLFLPLIVTIIVIIIRLIKK